MTKKSQAAMEFLMFRTKCLKLKNSKSAQAAMEFLMTYGWALLVVLIAIAALAFFGLLNPGRFLPEKCEITPGLTCVGFTAMTNGSPNTQYSNITILLNNGLGINMENIEVNISNCHRVNTTAQLIQGETAEMTILNCSLTPNTRFKSNMIVRYETVTDDNRLSHSKKGNINVEVNLE